MEEKIEYLFVLASLYDSNTGKLLDEAKERGIQSVQDWQEKMSHELAWMHDNRNMILLNLARLRKIWPKSCEMLDEILA